MKGFKAAQRAYENREDPNCQETPMKDCSECDGTGRMSVSSCCGAEMLDMESDICSDCKDHADLESCDDCGGTGSVEDDEEYGPDDDEEDEICPEGYDGT